MYPYDFVPWGETDCGRSNKKINITELKNTTTLRKFIFSIILVFIALSLSAWVEERGRDRPHTHLLLLLLHTHTHTRKNTYIHLHSKKSREKDTNYALVLAITPQLSNLDPLCHKCLQESVLYAPAYITVLVFFQVSCTVWSIWTCCHVAKKKGCLWVILHTLHTNTHTHIFTVHT